MIFVDIGKPWYRRLRGGLGLSKYALSKCNPPIRLPNKYERCIPRRRIIVRRRGVQIGSYDTRRVVGVLGVSRWVSDRAEPSSPWGHAEVESAPGADGNDFERSSIIG